MFSMPAIYVHDTKETPYAMQIVKGEKQIETRTRNVLKRFVGERVLVIRTRSSHKAEIVGEVTICHATWLDSGWLDENRHLTLIPKGSKFDCAKMGKWCYWLKNPTEYEKPIPMTDYAVITRNMSYAILAR